jgi:hypothetical protein
MKITWIVMLAAAMAACSESPQTLGAPRSDTPAFGGGAPVFNAPGWKPGDKAAWEQQLRARGQATQNENVRIN